MSTAASSSHLQSSPEPVPGTSRDLQAFRQTPKHPREQLNLSIEVPSPSQVRSWTERTDSQNEGPQILNASLRCPRSIAPSWRPCLQS